MITIGVNYKTKNGKEGKICAEYADDWDVESAKENIPEFLADEEIDFSEFEILYAKEHE